MKTAIISEKFDNKAENLLKAFNERKIDAEFVEVGDLGVFVENNTSTIFHASKNFSEFDAAFVDLPMGFTLFAEPFLSELVDSGIYCQMKPNSFYALSNKPFSYSTLSLKGVKIPKTDILGHKDSVDSSIDEFDFPVIVKTFLGLKKTNSVLVESERSLKSFIKSIAVEVDAITIQEYMQGDVDQSLIIGDDVYSVKRRWIDKELAHSKKAVTTKVSDEDSEMAIKAVKVLGMDVGIVKMINGSVIGVRNSIDFEFFNSALSQNTYEKLAIFYKEKIEGT